MKILMVTMSLGIGGAETHILELTRELIRRGHRIVLASSGGLFVDALTEAGARHVDVPLHTHNPAALAGAYRTLSRLMREESFDVIHAHARIPGFVSSLLAKQFDVPMATTFHGTFNPVWYWRMLTRVGEGTLAVSDDVKEYLMRYYGTPEEIIGVTVNGIDTARFDAADPAVRRELEADLSLPAGDRILAVTRLDRASAWHVFRLIEAMPQIIEERPDAQLVIVGGGDVLDEVAALAKETNDALGEERIRVLGPRQDVARLLSTADIFVGVSRAAMEAMACRIPVVLSGAQGHMGVFVASMEAEAVQTNFCCRTREAADTDTMARAVITLLSASPEERRAMGEYNRSLVKRLYSVSRMADDAEGLYTRVIHGHRYRRADVVISGYYGFGNAGDDALLTSIADGLRVRGIRRIAALAKPGARLTAGVRPISRLRLISMARAIRGAKLLISGGGSLLQDATSTKSLWYYTTVMRFAKRSGVPVMVLANGIGPITREKNRRRAAAALAMADYVSVREEASARELCAMGLDPADVHVSADPVYRAGVATDAADTLQDTVVLSLRETADGKSADGVEDAAVRALTEVCRSYNLAAALLPMQPRYDAAICARAASRLEEAGVEVKRIFAADSAALERELSGARAVVGMRLHALIFATAAAVPSLALSYDPKVDALMEYLGMQDYVLPAFSADADAIRQALERLLRESDAVSAGLRTRAATLASLADRDLDEAARMVREG